MFLQGKTPDPSDMFGEHMSLGKYVWGHTFPGGTHITVTTVWDNMPRQLRNSGYATAVTLHATLPNLTSLKDNLTPCT